MPTVIVSVKIFKSYSVNMSNYIKNGIAVSAIIGGGILAFGGGDSSQKITPVQEVRGINSSSIEPKNGCNKNYSGCVPIASDVDCAGGSGNGPEYVRGPIKVTGRDVYGLDRDNDGVACE